MRVQHTAFILLLDLLLSVTSVYAFDFYGANVIDSDVPSSYFKVGLFGFRPIIDTISIDSPAAKHGFQRGDIISSINGRNIKRSAELTQFKTNVLQVSIFRNREKMTLTIGESANETTQTKPMATIKQSALQQGAPTQSVPNSPAKVIRTQEVSSQKLPANDDIFKRPIKPAQDQIVFENKKGAVIFSHSIHLRSLDKDQCMLCHRIENPTHEFIQSRLDNHRAAHGFCRGCHQNTANAPTAECQVCHNYNKKE